MNKLVRLVLIVLLTLPLSPFTSYGSGETKTINQQPQTYLVRFNTNDGSSVPASSVQPGGTVSKPADPKRAGYVFDGWYSNSRLTKKVTFPYTPSRSITLYAKWDSQSQQTYTDALDFNRGIQASTQALV